LAEPESLCVYCRRRQVDLAWQPFCSERCRMADLGRWLSEDYRVPEESPTGSLDGRPDEGAHRENDDH
jgi:endogenous inhibitor of DNA gyrase (YacG/DUF329 family)